MYDRLTEINSRPEPFQFYTAEDLWCNEHTSRKMLEYHLNDSVDLSSRSKSFIERSVKWIVSRFELDATKNVADFGCGPGLYTTRFAETRASVTGIDFSERSIKYAKDTAVQRGLDIKYFQENYLEFETDERFDLITMIFCDFCALSPRQRNALLTKFYKFLKPDGSVFLDVHSMNTFNSIDERAVYERNQLDHFWAPDDYWCFLNTFKYEKEKVSLDKYTIIDKTQSRVVYNWLQFFNQETLKQEFEKCGFEVVELYSDVAGTSFNPDSADIAAVVKKKSFSQGPKRNKYLHEL